MIVLDTNVVSEIGKAQPSQHVAAWVLRQNEEELYICVPVAAEMAFGGYRIWLRDQSRRYLDSLDDLIAGVFATACCLSILRLLCDMGKCEHAAKPSVARSDRQMG